MIEGEMEGGDGHTIVPDHPADDDPTRSTTEPTVSHRDDPAPGNGDAAGFNDIAAYPDEGGFSDVGDAAVFSDAAAHPNAAAHPDAAAVGDGDGSPAASLDCDVAGGDVVSACDEVHPADTAADTAVAGVHLGIDWPSVPDVGVGLGLLTGAVDALLTERVGLLPPADL